MQREESRLAGLFNCSTAPISDNFILIYPFRCSIFFFSPSFSYRILFKWSRHCRRLTVNCPVAQCDSAATRAVAAHRVIVVQSLWCLRFFVYIYIYSLFVSGHLLICSICLHWIGFVCVSMCAMVCMLCSFALCRTWCVFRAVSSRLPYRSPAVLFMFEKPNNKWLNGPMNDTIRLC